MYQIHLGGDINEFPPLPPPPPPPPPSVQPPSPNNVCEGMFQQWAKANPTLVKCLTMSDLTSIIQTCVHGVKHEMTQADAARSIQSIIGAACLKKAVPPPAPPRATPPSPPPAAPPPARTAPPPSSAPPSSDGGAPGGNGGGDTSTQPHKAFLRQVGPIVGIGLLVAVGLTVARKRALTKHRRRK